MKLTIVGSGCTWTKRENSCFLIDDKVMIDVPQGIMKSLYKLGKRDDNLDCILLTHFHSDHYFDISIIIYDIALYMRPNKVIKIITPPGGKRKIMSLLKFAASDQYQDIAFDKYFEVIEAKPNALIDIGDYVVEVVKMDHGKITNHGYIVTEKSTGKAVAFSGDTTMCNNIFRLIESSEVCMLDMAEVHTTPNHLGYNDFVKIAKKYPSKIIYPVHMAEPSFEIAYKEFVTPYDGEIIQI